MEQKKQTRKTEEHRSETKKVNVSNDNKEILAVVRIIGSVKKKPEILETLFRLRLRKKYSCVLINTSRKDILGMLKLVRYSVAYGNVNKDTLIKLLNTRGKSVNKKTFNSEEIADNLIQGKDLKEMGIKPFFRLHPPRKGINSKDQFPKGVLGNHGKEINKLLERML